MNTRYAAILIALAAGYSLAAEESPAKTATTPTATAKSASKPAAVSTAKSIPAVRKPAPIVVHKPVVPRSRSAIKTSKRPTNGTGKVTTLSATSLPPGAIVPPLKNFPAKVTENPPPQAAVYVLTDPTLRWQFYSYP